VTSATAQPKLRFLVGTLGTCLNGLLSMTVTVIGVPAVEKHNYNNSKSPASDDCVLES
jgi:hypothetical protein